MIEFYLPNKKGFTPVQKIEYRFYADFSWQILDGKYMGEDGYIICQIPADTYIKVNKEKYDHAINSLKLESKLNNV